MTPTPPRDALTDERLLINQLAKKHGVTSKAPWGYHEFAREVRATLAPAAPAPTAPTQAVPQSPIARIRIDADGDIEFAGIYAPGLPPGTEHDLYLEPTAEKAAKRPAEMLG